MIRRTRLCSRVLVVGAVVVALRASSAGAQPPQPASTRGDYIDAGGVSVDDLVRMALERAPSIRATRARVDIARGDRLQAGLRPNPMVATERRDEVGGTDNQSSVMVEWPLDLFRRSARVRHAERAIEVSQRQVEESSRQLAARVREQAGRLLAVVRHIEIADRLRSAARQAHELLTARAKDGAAPPLDRDLAFVEWQRVEAMRHRLSGDEDVAFTRLKTLVGLEPGAPLALREPLETLVLREHQETWPFAKAGAPDSDAAADRRADVQTARALADQAAAQVDRARRDGRLDLSLYGGYMRMDAGFPQLGLTRGGELTRIRGVFHNVSVGAVVSVPWLNRNQGAVAAAEAARRAAEHEHTARLLDARGEVAAARDRDEKARRAVAVYASGLRDVARRNVEVVRESYQLGRVSLFDVIAEQRRYLDIETAYTEALADAFEARTGLAYALGVMP